jgi:hydrogenase-4 component F
LFHTLNHSLGKILSFFSAGRLGQIFGTLNMEKMSGVLKISPIWGIGIFGSFLALIGAAPFSLFMSEIQILKAALENKSVIVIVLFLSGVAVVFVGMLGRAIPLLWKRAEGDTAALPKIPSGILEKIIVIVPLTILLILGIWMPEPLRMALTQASNVIQNIAPAVVLR